MQQVVEKLRCKQYKFFDAPPSPDARFVTQSKVRAYNRVIPLPLGLSNIQVGVPCHAPVGAADCQSHTSNGCQALPLLAAFDASKFSAHNCGCFPQQPFSVHDVSDGKASAANTDASMHYVLQQPCMTYNSTDGRRVSAHSYLAGSPRLWVLSQPAGAAA
jgi:hypothetical protein